VDHRDADALADAVEMLGNHKELTLQDADAVAAAVDVFRSRRGLGFSDCLMLEVARMAGCLPVGAFDRGFGEDGGAERL